MGSRRTSRSTGPVSKHGKTRKTAVPPKVAESPGYAVSQRLRKRIEESFGWMKTVGGLTQLRVRGLAKSAPLSSSPWPPTTSSACPSSWPRGAKGVNSDSDRAGVGGGLVMGVLGSAGKVIVSRAL